MISLGGSSTYLQNQIISGFDSVAQGFTATATTTSAAAMQTAQDSFSSFDTNETTALASMGSQQQISGAAEFSNPATYMQSQGVQANEPVLRAFQDPSLASGGDLSAISEVLTRVTSDAEQKGIIIVSGSPTQLQQRASTKIEQAGLITPPQIGGSTKFEQAGVITPPQVGGSTKLEQAGVITPPQFGAYDAITFSPQQTTALASMSKTVSDAASLFQNVNVSMLGRKIVG